MCLKIKKNVNFRQPNIAYINFFLKKAMTLWAKKAMKLTADLFVGACAAADEANVHGWYVLVKLEWNYKIK